MLRILVSFCGLIVVYLASFPFVVVSAHLHLLGFWHFLYNSSLPLKFSWVLYVFGIPPQIGLSNLGRVGFWVFFLRGLGFDHFSLFFFSSSFSLNLSLGILKWNECTHTVHLMNCKSKMKWTTVIIQTFKFTCWQRTRQQKKNLFWFGHFFFFSVFKN